MRWNFLGSARVPRAAAGVPSVAIPDGFPRDAGISTRGRSLSSDLTLQRPDEMLYSGTSEEEWHETSLRRLREKRRLPSLARAAEDLRGHPGDGSIQ